MVRLIKTKTNLEQKFYIQLFLVKFFNCCSSDYNYTVVISHYNLGVADIILQT